MDGGNLHIPTSALNELKRQPEIRAVPEYMAGIEAQLKEQNQRALKQQINTITDYFKHPRFYPNKHTPAMELKELKKTLETLDNNLLILDLLCQNL